MKDYIDNYFTSIKNFLDGVNRGSIENVTRLIECAFHDRKHIYIIGNGGSAATASHMANDFSKGIKTTANKYIKALSLTDNVPLLTAISNDDGYENIFLDQLKIFLNEGDLVIGISASGNSANVIRALQFAKDKGAKTIGIIGFDGGKIKSIVDYYIHIETPKGLYGPVEDIHLILDHVITGYLTCKLGNIQK